MSAGWGSAVVGFLELGGFVGLSRCSQLLPFFAEGAAGLFGAARCHQVPM